MLKLISGLAKTQRRHFATNSKSKNHYESLGISSTSTQGEVKSAYYKLSMLHHPDKNQGNEESLKIFRDITAAYEVLGNVKTRKLYDRGLYVNIDTQTVEEQPLHKFYKSRATRTRPPTPTGSVPIYDFDEWSKSHYGATFQRLQENRRRMQEYRRERDNYKDDIKMEWFIFGSVGILFSYVMISFYLDYDLPSRKPKSLNSTRE